MTNDKILNSIFKSPSFLLTIRARTSFSKTLQKLNRAQKAEFVFVERANSQQMAAVILARLFGKKFLWLQAFSNPPSPDFITRLLLNQADEIVITSRILAAKLRRFGVEKPRVRIVNG